MSYNGTVRCSWCYNVGHNKAGCPQRKKYALENPDSYEAKRYFAEQERRKETVKNRVCSYCGGKDHNRRGCKVLKEDRSLIIQRQEKYEKHFADVCNSAGLGPGTLIKIADQYNEDKYCVGLITSMYPSNIDFLFQDTEAVAHYSMRERTFFNARIVSTSGYTEEDRNSWSKPPAFNDHLSVSAGSIQSIIPEAFADTEAISRTHGRKAEILSKSTRKVPEKFNDSVPEQVLKRFAIKVEKNADKWDKQRVRLLDSVWDKIRPEEHREAKQKRKEENNNEY